MPKTQIDYSKTSFYRIVCKDLTITDCYVGHTTNFTKRKNAHKSDCHNENSPHYNLIVYEFIRANGGWDNWNMILITTQECNDYLDAVKKEREYIELYNATLNIHKNIGLVIELGKKEWSKKYYEQNIEEKKEYLKEYYERNKKQIDERQKQYRERNKEQIKKQQKEKIDCECGGCYQKTNKSYHIKSKKHISYLAENKIFA